jgi:predicted helicase
MPVRVIIGNPPWRGASKNKLEFDEKVKAEYAPSGEKKMNWDDYEKFVCFAHQKMKAIDRGVIGIITSNNFLNAITKRQMRTALMRDFSAIYILNLHGDSLVGDMAPDGRPDKNVFDIKVGVSISLFVRDVSATGPCRVHYASIRSSSQKDKWRQVAEADLSIFHELDVAGFNRNFATTRWKESFAEDFSPFMPSDEAIGKTLSAYGDFWGLKQIFGLVNSGVETARDDLAIQMSESKIEEITSDL